MLAVMLGGRSLIARLPFLAKRSRGIQRGFGLVMIFAALSIAMQWDRSFQKAILDAFPRYGSGLLSFENSRTVKNALAARSGVGLSRPSSPLSPSVSISSDGRFAGVVDGSLVSRSMGDYGGIPDFPPGSTWLNSAPIDAKSLAGKVVLVDFWTFSCVNCIRTLPYLRRLYDSYKDEGLVIVGVHSPEFTFERVASNVQKAARDLGVVWPIILDNDYSLWKAYGNRYWPAEYIVDAKGRVRYWHFGEGGYEESEKIVRSLLAEVSPLRASAAAMADPSSIWAEATEAKTPETYLGYARGRGFASAVEPVPDKLAEYRPARVPGGGEWNLSGSWTIRAEHSESQGSSPASIELGFDAKDVYLVIEAVEAGASMRVRLDGEIPADTRDLEKGSLVPDSGRLYHLVSLAASGGHVLHIDVKGKMRLFAFTFG
jgi:thiol-disulfide isomerase/thioredoxin